MSAIDDFAEIAKRLREITDPATIKRKVKAELQQAAQNQLGNQVPGHSQQYSQGIQAQQAVGAWPSCPLCFDEGWIAIRRGGLWVGVTCPRCGNPSRRGCPTI